MKSNLKRVEKIWRRTRMIFFLCPISIALIVGIDIAVGPERGGGTPLQLIGYGLLLLVYSSFIFGLCWLTFRFVRFVIEMRDESQ